jgi:hypothetical protein
MTIDKDTKSVSFVTRNEGALTQDIITFDFDSIDGGKSGDSWIRIYEEIQSFPKGFDKPGYKPLPVHTYGMALSKMETFGRAAKILKEMR